MKRAAIFIAILSSITTPAIAISAVAQQTKPARKPHLVQLVIRPASEPVPAMKYQLLPALPDQTCGNAVPLYHTALELAGSELHRRQWFEEADKYLSKPASHELPTEKVRKLVGHYQTALRYLELAARRQTCDWDRPLMNGVDMQLPEVGRLRDLGKVLALRIRLEIAEHKLDQALHDLQTGFAMARHIADGPTLIESLVGIAIGGMMIERVEEFIRSAESPNLYWALAGLPRPFIDIRKPMQLEGRWIYVRFAQLRGLGNAKLSQQQARTLMDKLIRLLQALDPEKVGQSPEAYAKKLTTEVYPQAKQHLARKGLPAHEIGSMPRSQAVLIYMLDTFERTRDDMFKWLNVPYWQARPGMAEAEEQLTRTRARPPMNPLLHLLPRLSRAYFSAVRLDRRIAALRCIEAIRLYAACHGGKLPRSLSDISEAPVPCDPVTGKAFAYSVDESKAVLKAPAPQGMSLRYETRYELTVSR